MSTLAPSRLLALVAALFVLAPASTAFATTYYVSPTGSDASSGSSSSPWRTIGKVNNARFAPGDAILFQGGQTFSDATLMPSVSGTAAAPIRFGSYGVGRAIFKRSSSNVVWLPDGVHDLAFESLELTGSSGMIFASSASGSGTYGIRLENAYLHDTPAGAINVAIAADHDWTITGSTVRHTGDSGVFIRGARVSLTRSQISDTGWNTAIAYSRHGVYDKGPDTTIAYNDISQSLGGQAVSLRFHGARVYGNTIHDTRAAIGFFDYDTAPAPQGTSYVYGNRMWNIGAWAFYYSKELDPQGRLPSVSFAFASNTVLLSAATEAVNLSEVPVTASVELANNIFTGSYGSAYRGCGTCVEHHNDWNGATSATPSGVGDTTAAPALSPAPDLAPLAGSPVVDAGVSSVTGLFYLSACDGGVLHFCGRAPELGAVEAVLAGSADTVAPTAPGALAVSGVTSSGATVAWTASSDDVGVAGYRVSVNGSAAGTTSAPTLTLGGLACGTASTISVVAFDAAGNASPASSAGVQTAACADTTPPETTILSGPTGSTTATDASFSFASNEAGSTFECRLDGGTWTACASPRAYTGLAVATHVFDVRARDAAGNVDATPASSSWTVTAPPSSTTTNLIVNGSFEGSLTNWKSSDGALSLANDGKVGAQAGRSALATAGAWSFSLAPIVRPVASTVAGTTYTAGGWIRSDTPGRNVCLRIREYDSAGNVVAAKDQCMSSPAAWTAFAPLTYTTARSGGTLTAYVFENGAQAGDSFEADGLTLSL